MYMKNLFIAEATIKKQHVNERHFQDTTPILGSFTDYPKKRSFNRMIDSHWALQHIALNAFNATHKFRFSIKSLNTVSHFSTLDCWCEKKTSISRDQVIKKCCDTFQQKWKQAGWAPQIHNQYLQSQALVSPWSHFSIHCILLRNPRRSSKPSQCCWSGDGSASIQPGQKTQRRISLSPI